MKKCSRCKKELGSEKFYKDKSRQDGFQLKCKDCIKQYYEENKDRIVKYKKKYFAENKDKIKQYLEKNKDKFFKWRAQYCEKNKDKIKQYRKENKDKQKQYYEKNKGRICAWHKQYREENKDKRKQYLEENRERINQHVKKRLLIDMQYKLTKRLRIRLWCALKNNQKTGSAVKDLGCSIPELKTYLEKQFQEGMSWKNWGNNGWHIDHKIPLDSFDLTHRSQFLKAVHYTNLQPLWAFDNMSKHNKILECFLVLDKS